MVICLPKLWARPNEDERTLLSAGSRSLRKDVARYGSITVPALSGSPSRSWVLAKMRGNTGRRQAKFLLTQFNGHWLVILALLVASQDEAPPSCDTQASHQINP